MSILERVDHLVYAAPDLDAACADVAERLGVQASIGGAHPGRGTRNALVAVGPSCYIEIIAPDPSQPDPPNPRWFGIDDLKAPRLVTWACKARDLQRLVDDTAERGLQLGPISASSRQRPDGVLLRWILTTPNLSVGEGIVPFFIDWGHSTHPSTSAQRGPTLVSLRALHPEPYRVRTLLAALDLDLAVDPGPHPRLIASFQRGSTIIEVQ